MSEVKFLKCAICGKIVGVIQDSAAPTMCCGQPMEEIVPGTTDAAKEKHVPVIEVDGSKVVVKIGEVAHPMEEDHWIAWVYIKTEKGGQRKVLKPGEAPEAVFELADDKLVAAYEYCNKHGLWMARA